MAGRADYEERREARIERLREKAESLREEADAYLGRANKKADAIPFGQPILVGHYSEGRDRNYRAGIRRDFQKAFEAQAKAEYYEKKAKAAENNRAISSDCPWAVRLLKEKIAALEKRQERMKEANKIIRKHKDNPAAARAELTSLGFSDVEIHKIITPDYMGRVGFQSWALSNNNAEIRRLKKRVEMLEQLEQDETQEIVIGDVRIVDNVEENRVQIFFPDKPAEEIRSKLRSLGFVWAPSVKAWQRKRNGYAFHAARQFIQSM